jgi:hypothetical protein
MEAKQVLIHGSTDEYIDIDVSLFPGHREPKTIREKIFWVTSYTHPMTMTEIKDMLPHCNPGTVAATVSQLTNPEHGKLLEAIPMEGTRKCKYRRMTKDTYVDIHGKAVYRNDPDTHSTEDTEKTPETPSNEGSKVVTLPHTQSPLDATPITMETLRESMGNLIILASDIMQQISHLQQESGMGDDERMELEQLRAMKALLKGALK